MENITIKRVTTKRELKQFVEFHYDLYADSRYNVPPLFDGEISTLRKDRNAAFEFCEAEYFLALDGKGKIVGRVAGIINHRANERWQRRSVRFGWIDFVNDLDVLRHLLDAVEQWGREHGMTEVIGPLGFTDMDPEGMLREGFEEMGTMPTIYNYEYYPQLMEQLGGYEKDNDYVEYKLMVPKEMPEKYAQIAEMISKRYDLHVRKLTKKDVFEGGYGKEMFRVINICFKDLYGYSELSDRQMDQYIKMYFPMADLNLITVVEDRSANNKMVAVGISIPSLSEALRKCRRGRLFPFGWWHVLRALKAHKTRSVDLLLVGVLPEYRRKGANALLFSDLIPRYQAHGWEWGETQVEMETNESVQSQWQYLDRRIHKRRRVYKKEI